MQVAILLGITAIISGVHACVEVAPIGVRPQPNRNSPYELDYSPQVSYVRSTEQIFQLYVEVKVKVTEEDSPVARFELRMEDISSGATLGTWRTVPKFRYVTNAVACPGRETGVLTSSKPLLKGQRVVAGIWRPDSGYRVNVRPVATVVRDEETFWRDIKGSIYYHGGFGANSAGGISPSVVAMVMALIVGIVRRID